MPAEGAGKAQSKPFTAPEAPSLNLQLCKQLGQRYVMITPPDTPPNSCLLSGAGEIPGLCLALFLISSSVIPPHGITGAQL